MGRKKNVAINKEHLVQEIDRRIAEGEKVRTIAFAVGLPAGIVQEFVHLSELKNKREQEALQIQPPEYLNCFGDYFNKLNGERNERDN